MMRTRTLPPFHPLSSIPPTAAEKEEIQRDNDVLAEILSLREEEFLALASFRDGKEGKRAVVVFGVFFYSALLVLALELSVVVLRPS